MSKSYLNSHPDRGFRNNNPGNLVRTKEDWKGKIPFARSKDEKFEQFTNMTYGIRAMLRDVVNDIGKGKNTVRKLISEYAPPSENNTNAYVLSVSKIVGIPPDTTITKVDKPFLMLLARAIIKKENGDYHTLITDSDIREAISIIGTFKIPNVKVSTSGTVSLLATIGLTALLFFYTFVTLTI